MAVAVMYFGKNDRDSMTGGQKRGTSYCEMRTYTELLFHGKQIKSQYCLHCGIVLSSVTPVFPYENGLNVL